MRQNPDNAPEKQEAYRLKLEGMTDEQLFTEAKDKIWLSAYATDNSHSCFHWQCDATYTESARRNNTDIYDRAHKYHMQQFR